MRQRGGSESIKRQAGIIAEWRQPASSGISLASRNYQASVSAALAYQLGGGVWQ
jgi:hypothetical protein